MVNIKVNLDNQFIIFYTIFYFYFCLLLSNILIDVDRGRRKFIKIVFIHNQICILTIRIALKNTESSKLD